MKTVKKTMNLPGNLLHEAVKLSGATNQTMAVILALEEFIKQKKIEKILRLKGTEAIKLSKNEMKKSRERYQICELENIKDFAVIPLV